MQCIGEIGHLKNVDVNDVPVQDEKLKDEHIMLLSSIFVLLNSIFQYRYTPLAKLLAWQARPGTMQDGSRNKVENYSSISATNQHQSRRNMYE